MPRVRAAAGFSGLIESDSEPDFDNFQSSRPMSTLVPAKSAGAVKARGRPPANAHKVTKPVQKTAPRAHTNTTARQALQDKPANTDTKGRSYKDMGDSDMEPDLVKPVQPTRARPNPTIPTTKVSHKSSSLQGRPPKARAVETVAESDPEDAMELDDGDGGEDEGEDVNKEELEDSHIDYVEPSRTTRKHSTDDDTDSLRAELEELRRRYGSLEARHKELREVGVKEAERNYDRLKRQADENSAASSKLISELRAELAARSSLGKKLEGSESKCEDLQAKVSELTTSLTDARSEIKTLNTKLSAARNAEVNAKVHGSALKPNGGFRGAPVEVVQTAQAKEDLYGDLTGLIVRGMKHDGKEDVFDCIQAGRNGTLHFKLALDAADASGYEDVQYTYRPQLDPGRDGELMDILPYYLLEEITFPRLQASKFYSRVTKSLSESLG